MSDESLLARARASADEKRQRRVYSAELLSALDEPLDLRPPPEVAAGVAWPEAVRTATVAAEPPPRSTRPVVGILITAAKRGIHRALRWYLPPVAEQVSRHNSAVLDVLGEHNRQIVELQRELEALRRRVSELEARSNRSR
jgi:hypothetical protein